MSNSYTNLSLETMSTVFQRKASFGKPSPTLLINEQSRALEKEGKTIYKLGFGQSPFPVPAEVVEVLRENAYQKDYLPVMGLYPLREAVARFYQIYQRQGSYEGQGNSIETNQVMIGPGSKELIFLTQLALKASLLLPSPSWVSYEPQAALLNLETYWISTQIENDWKLKAEDLETACRAVKGPKLLILNYPNNPTGNSYNKEELKEFAEIANRENLFILSDEIYSLLNFNTKNIDSIANHCPEKTIISSGLSKWAGAGGWRLGTFVFPKSQKKLQQAIGAMASETFSCVSAPIQYAAVKAFEESPTIKTYQKNSRAILSFVASYVVQRLENLKVKCPVPLGGFYVFPSFENHRPLLESKGIKTSTQLCDFLLKELGIALLPGIAFGRPEKELTVRLSYVDFDGAVLLKEVEENGMILKGEVVMKQYFPKIYEAMNLLEGLLVA